MTMVNKVKFLLSPEPGKSQKSRTSSMILPIEKDMCIERCSTGNHLSDKKIKGQYEIGARSQEEHRNEEEGRIVAFIAAVGF